MLLSGGGGGWGNWREWGREWGDGFGNGLKGLLSTLGAIVAFAAAVFVVALWQPVLAYVVSFLRWILRLDGPGRSRGRSAQPPPLEGDDPDAEIGNLEQRIISKYGGEDDFFHSEDEEGGEGDDDDE